jgi:hypothetical protein
VRNGYDILVGNLEGKRPHGIYRRKWEGNIKMDFKRCVVSVWTVLTIGTNVELFSHLNEPSRLIKDGELSS